MCDDSPAERRYWMQRVAALRREMEQEDRERQSALTTRPAAPVGVEREPLSIRIARALLPNRPRGQDLR